MVIHEIMSQIIMWKVTKQLKFTVTLKGFCAVIVSQFSQI